MIKNAYNNIRLTSSLELIHSSLSKEGKVKSRPIGTILEPDDITMTIIEKYKLSLDVVLKLCAFNNVSIYAIVVLPGLNDKSIVSDMKEMGCFVSHCSRFNKINNINYQVIKFETESRLQIDETDSIKNSYDFLFHWCPQNRLNGIMNNGLIPSCRNNTFNYPPRVYLMKGDSKITDIRKLGRILCSINEDYNNNGKYVLLKIGIKELDEDIKLFYDPSSKIGIYTEQSIPRQNIEIVDTYEFKNFPRNYLLHNKHIKK